MNESDKPRFFSMLKQVMDYYRQDSTEFMFDIFWDSCKDFDYEVISKALNAHAKDPDRGQFAPKVADIVRQLSGTKTDKSMIAWGKVHDAMGRVGAYSDVVFDDPAIHAAVSDCGGWVKMCRTETDELSYLQHRFCQSYQAYASRDDFDYPHVLGGDRSPDELYAKRGLPAPKPVLLGNPEKARIIGGGESLAKKVAALMVNTNIQA